MGGQESLRPRAEAGDLSSAMSAAFRLHRHTMDDSLELPNADVSRLQERGQSEGADDGGSSADEEEGGLDWTKLPWGFQLFFHPVPFEFLLGL